MTKKSYSTQIKTQELTVDNVDYVIKQASAGVTREYRNKQAGTLRMGPNGKPIGFNDIGSIEPFLVSKCLFEVDSQKAVSYDTICSWPQDMVKDIYNDIRTLSDLKDEEGVREKFGTIFDHPDSPVKMSDLRDWASKFKDNEEYSEVFEWLEPTSEEKAKNLQPSLDTYSE